MTPPADLRLLAGTRQGRVVDVALGTAAIEGLGFERSERGALLQALDQIRIADKGATEGKQVRLALGQSTAGQRQVITVIGQIGLLEAPTQAVRGSASYKAYINPRTSSAEAAKQFCRWLKSELKEGEA